MVIQINVNNPQGLKKGEMIIFDGKEFHAITKEQIIGDLKKQIKKLQEEIEAVKAKTITTRKQVNKRQRRFLQSFIKEVK